MLSLCAFPKVASLDANLQTLDQLGWAWLKREFQSSISGGKRWNRKKMGLISMRYRDTKTVKTL